MDRKDRNMEELFRTLFEQFTVTPAPGLWNKVQAKIKWKQFLSFGLNSLNVFYLTLMLALAGAGAYFMLPLAEARGTNENREAQPASQDSPPEQTYDRVISREDPDASLVEVPVSVESAPLKTAGIIVPATPATTREKESDHRSMTGKSSSDRMPEKKSAGLAVPEDAAPENRPAAEPESVRTRIDFEAHPLSGCSPLAVNFQNFSENAGKMSWNFGDGGNSDEANPSYVFDEPGEFLVTLRVQGADGLEYSQQQTIQVYETPKALFEFDEDVKPASNQPINFYNYSRGGDYYEWDFGDNQRSGLQEPIHLYEKTGNYHVKLKVWTDHQCYDSLVVFNAFTTQEQDIKVPNAFTPNLNGPTGGYYDVNDYSNTVFHPVTNGELIEFQLKVFNRKGVLLFESNDISIGWDGYYCEQLVKQDVYIWKIRGKFNNGKTFVESGDVTLIKLP